MRPLLVLLLVCCASIAGYLCLFGFLVSRPLVVDQVGEMLDFKLSYARASPSPKIFIIAGSNARFSHSCAVIEARVERPCVNLGIAGDVSLDWLFDASRPYLRSGDVVYLPVEFPMYWRTRAAMLTGLDAAYRWRRDKASLWRRGVEGMARAAFMFELRDLIVSLGEMALHSAGFRRRLDTATLDIQGDEIGHTDTLAKSYEEFVRSAPFELPDPRHILDNPDGLQAAIAEFLDWCKANGVVAIGGLPTVFDDQNYSDDLIDELRAFYAHHGAEFLELPNHSQYPRGDFFDGPAHLRQRAQAAHSELIAAALRKFLH